MGLSFENSGIFWLCVYFRLHVCLSGWMVVLGHVAASLSTKFLNVRISFPDRISRTRRRGHLLTVIALLMSEPNHWETGRDLGGSIISGTHFLGCTLPGCSFPDAVTANVVNTLGSTVTLLSGECSINSAD